MGDTTLTLSEDAKEELGTIRHPGHDSWNDTIEAAASLVPSVEEVHENGCSNCEETAREQAPIEDIGGVIHFYHHEIQHGETTRDVYVSEWFCSDECFREEMDQRDTFTDRHPDLACIGGIDEIRAEVTPEHFEIRERNKILTLEVPGAFGGTSTHGEYDYIGEPVYVKNDGQWVHSGVVEEIVHEEKYTHITVSHDDWHVTGPNHPSEERQAEYWEDWKQEECPECGGDFRRVTREDNDSGECMDCDHATWNDTGDNGGEEEEDGSGE